MHRFDHLRLKNTCASQESVYCGILYCRYSKRIVSAAGSLRPAASHSTYPGGRFKTVAMTVAAKGRRVALGVVFDMVSRVLRSLNLSSQLLVWHWTCIPMHAIFWSSQHQVWHWTCIPMHTSFHSTGWNPDQGCHKFWRDAVRMYCLCHVHPFCAMEATYCLRTRDPDFIMGHIPGGEQI